MSVRDLDAYLYGHFIGVFYSDGVKASFGYSDTWSGQSVSLGLQRGDTHANAMAYLRGLLPDNEVTLEHWEHDYGVKHGDTVGMLAMTGRDAPGAIQLVAHGEPSVVR